MMMGKPMDTQPVTGSTKLLVPDNQPVVALKDAPAAVVVAACLRYYTLLTMFMIGQYVMIWLIRYYLEPLISPPTQRFILYATIVLWSLMIIVNYSSYGRNWRTKSILLRALVVNVMLASVIFFMAFVIPLSLLQEALLAYSVLMASASALCFTKQKLNLSISFPLLVLINLAVVAAWFGLYLQITPADIDLANRSTVQFLFLAAAIVMLAMYSHWRLLVEIKERQLNQHEIAAMACSVVTIVVVAGIVEIYSIVYLVVLRSKGKMILAFSGVVVIILEYNLRFI
jgi:hypothetical protein